MIKPYLYSGVVAGLLLSFFFFNNSPPESTGKTGSAHVSTDHKHGQGGLKKISPQHYLAKKTAHNSEQLELLPSAISALVAEEKAREAQLSKELIRKYKKTRNLYLADTTMSTADKQQLIAQLDTTIFGDGQPDYEPSNEDLYEQARYREIMSNLQHDAQTIKFDSSLSRQQKEDEIRQLLSNFIADIDG